MSNGYKRTVDKIARYYNMLLVVSIMDALLIVSQAHSFCSLPCLPYLTIIGALFLCFIELKSIFEKAADKTKLDGLSGGGLNIPAYIFPGDPSKLDSSASSTHITSILGTAIDLLDAFNNGRVFISKTVTFNEVQVPSDITYSLLKSIDPDNPTIFQIIMSTVVWGHYIEITIDFENNEYQVINNTINGSISVNTSGTSN